jgi:cytochrome P450
MRLNREFIQDPHALYQRLRNEGPISTVTFLGGVPAWLVTRYQEARQLLNDPRLGKDHYRALELLPSGTSGLYVTALDAHMLNSDPPDHTRLRKLVSKAFNVRTVAQLRPTIEQITDELLDNMAAGGSVDLIESFAQPLPLRVIGALLGIPKADNDSLSTWTTTLVSGAAVEEISEAQDQFTEYLTRLLVDKRVNPENDLISELVHVSEHGDQLSDAELLTMIFLLVVAGHETTANLIGNGVLALLRNPSQLVELRADSRLLSGAVEEFLRYDSPLNVATIRFTTAQITVGKVEIPASQLVLISLLSANHDEDQFDHPERLDVHRPVSPHLAFGHGIHYCLGAPLARLEAEVALGTLLRRFRTIRLDENAPTPRYRASTVIHGLDALPVWLAV